MGISTVTRRPEDESRCVDPFVHPAMFYADDHEYLTGLVPFVEEGLDLVQPVAVAVPGDRLRLLQDALGPSADFVLMIDMTAAGRNPGRIIPGVLRAFADAAPERHVRIIGEPIWAGRTATEYPACVQHEALINLAFTGRDLTILCPYDTTRLDRQVIDDARATHPTVWAARTREASDRFAPDEVLSRYNLPLPPAGDAATFTVRRAVELAALREFASAQCVQFGMSRRRTQDVRLIVTELAANSLLHAGSPCRLHLWRDATTLVCSAGDRGRLADPLAGRKPPAPGQAGGRGLLMINQLADLVRVHSGPDGTTIQAHIEISPTPSAFGASC